MPIAKLSREARPGGSLLAFASGNNPYPHHYSAAFAFSPILYPHHHRQTLRFGYPEGSDTGLPCSACVTMRGLGPSTILAAFVPMTGENGAPVPAAIEPDSIFGPFTADDTYRGLHLLTMPLSLGPIRLDAGRHTDPSRFRCPSDDGEYIVRGLLDDPLPNRYTS
jgi:hypothetical protein